MPRREESGSLSPSVTHFGRAIDIMVKAVKKSIPAVLGGGDVADKGHITVVTGTENVRNPTPRHLSVSKL